MSTLGSRLRSVILLMVVCAIAACAGQTSRSAAPGGVIVMVLSIDETGAVTNAKLVQSSGYPELDKAAIDSARKQHFSPKLEAGKPVASTRKVSVAYRVDPRGADNPESVEEMTDPQVEQ